MSGKRLTLWVALVLCLTVVALPSWLAASQSDSGDELAWFTVDGGGATFSTGNGYELSGMPGPSTVMVTRWTAAFGAQAFRRGSRQ